jgi:DeoR/GlpR family transcriptional regulator of sugar metabolism
MILSELRAYVADHGRVSLVDMAHRFDTDPETVRAMLQVLERKGRVRKLAVGGSCASGGCSKCSLSPPELYESL